MPNHSVEEDSAAGVTPEALVPEDSLIIGIWEGNTVIMSQDVGQVGFHYALFALEADIESSNCQV